MKRKSPPLRYAELRATVALGVSLLTGCASAPEAPATALADPPGRSVSQLPTAAQRFGAAFRPAYTVVEEQDISLGDVRRWRVRCTVPPGLSKNDLTKNLEHAAWRAYEAHPGAVLVLAYLVGTDTKVSFTAGRCEVAPNGNWMEATAKASPNDYRAVTELNAFYFRPRSGDASRVVARIPTAQRRRIYFAIVDADDRARNEASHSVPLHDPGKPGFGHEDARDVAARQTKLRQALQRQYRQPIAEANGLSAQDLEAIYVEGSEGHWPRPRPL
jgi:hypothetical protein